MNMNNVIGPINQADWKTMRNLNTSLKFMKKDPVHWKSAIGDETERYRKRLSKYLVEKK